MNATQTLEARKGIDKMLRDYAREHQPRDISELFNQYLALQYVEGVALEIVGQVYFHDNGVREWENEGGAIR